jgi:hypothetical protein
MGRTCRTYGVLAANLEGMRSLGRPMHKWQDNIKMDLRKIGCGVDSYGLGQGQMAGSCNRQVA